MTWEKELENRIIDFTDKQIFIEILNCLNSKCYRAGYIITWISIIENFKRKIFESSNTGDKDSQQSWKKIENLELSKKSVDLVVLEESKRLNLIDLEETTKLEFLYAQRSIFAHPYEKAPTEDELKYIISLSVDIALSKGIVYKKNFIDNLIIDLYEKPYFLPYNAEAVKSYAKKILPRIDKRLLFYFFKSLYAKVGELIDKNESDDFKYQRYTILISEIFRFTDESLENEKWGLEKFTLNYPYTAIKAFTNFDTWIIIPERIQEILVDFCAQNKYSEEIEYSRSVISQLIKNKIVSDSHIKKFDELLENRPFTEICNLSFGGDKLFERLLNDMSSGDFYKQRDCVKFLRTDRGKELLSSLKYNQLRSIGKEMIYAATHNCWEAQSFTRNIVLKDWPFDFGLGLFLGCFIDRRFSITIKSEYISYILIQINQFSNTQINRCFSITNSLISKANNESFYGGIKNLETILEKLEEDKNIKEDIKSNYKRFINLLNSRIIEMPF